MPCDAGVIGKDIDARRRAAANQGDCEQEDAERLLQFLGSEPVIPARRRGDSLCMTAHCAILLSGRPQVSAGAVRSADRQVDERGLTGGILGMIPVRRYSISAKTRPRSPEVLSRVVRLRLRTSLDSSFCGSDDIGQTVARGGNMRRISAWLSLALCAAGMLITIAQA